MPHAPEQEALDLMLPSYYYNKAIYTHDNNNKAKGQLKQHHINLEEVDWPPRDKVCIMSPKIDGKMLEDV